MLKNALDDMARRIKRFSPEQKLAAAKRVLAGESMSSIAREFGVSKGAPAQWVKRMERYEAAIAQRNA